MTYLISFVIVLVLIGLYWLVICYLPYVLIGLSVALVLGLLTYIVHAVLDDWLS